MKITSITAIAITSALTLSALSACSSLPDRNARLEEARADYRTAQARPQTMDYAAVELKQAGESLASADSAWLKGESVAAVDHLAYITKQEVAIAEQTTNKKIAETTTTTTSAERDRVRLQARTAEADASRILADTARLQAEDARVAAEAARVVAEAAIRDRQAAQIGAEAAKKTTLEAQKSEALQRQNAQLNAANAATAQREAIADKQAAAAANAASASASLAQQQAQIETQAAKAATIDAESRAAQVEAQLKDLMGKQSARGYVVTLGDVLFDTNKAQLNANGLIGLQKLATFSKQYPLRKVMVEGFTDSVGGASSNKLLSENRANAVLTALVGMGLSASRISAVGYGEAYPVAANDTFTGRQLNRRVEIIVSDDNGIILSR